MAEATSVEERLGKAVHQNSAMSRTGFLERVFSKLFTGLVYPQIWEDPVVDLEALALPEDANIVVISSGSCNAMSYLTAKPASVTAVDLSPAHIALGRLKSAAAQHLPDYEAFYKFFGYADRAVNVTAYDTHIAPHLDEDTRAFWGKRGLRGRRISMFANGFYRYGLLGRFLGLTGFALRLARVDVKAYFKCKTMEEQTAFFEREVAPVYDSWIVRQIAKNRASLFGLGIPPAQYDKLAADGGGDVIPVLKERTRKLMCDFPHSENYFVWQALQRRYDPSGEGPLPPYLQRENYEVVKAHADRFTIVNRSLTDLIGELPDETRDGYVFLDAQDWMTDDQLNALWTEVTRTARPGATVIFRTGGADDILPGRVLDATLSHWTYDRPASEKGFREDRSAIYGGFHVYRKTA